MTSVALYLCGYVLFSLTLFRRFPYSIVAFVFLLSVGVIDGTFLAATEGGRLLGPISDFAIPVAFMFFGCALIRVGGFRRFIGAGYLLAGAFWLISLIPGVGVRLSTPLGLLTEFVGANATIALILWAFYAIEKMKTESAVAVAKV
ncbi:hypothetical protein CKALI_09555 [Corynebacterium kalinowskii]|uniref:Uncharacterized protein n=1 Tax=Corynebacterium kalinowskii TaxID=2675216 RepID=A0A6B8VVQ3_9CORY|nr:hypothetical protein CKALI_09555 [Corynebacterium kalinowskii]